MSMPWTCQVKENCSVIKKKSVISLNVYSWTWNRKLFQTFNNSKEKSSRIVQKSFYEIKIIIIKRFLWKATSHNDHYIINLGGQRPKIGGNWPLTSPYLQHWLTIMYLFEHINHDIHLNFYLKTCTSSFCMHVICISNICHV